MQASKWLQIQALVDVDEMNRLLEELEPVHLFLIGEVIKKGRGELLREQFLERYQNYLTPLKVGKKGNFTQLSLAVTTSDEMVRFIPISEEEEMIRVVAPVIQLQMHRMGYSALDGKFRPMILGKDSISWGVQFSYPQLFQEDGEAMKVDESKRFPNTALFRTLQRWIRKNTVPTPFEVEGKKVNVPIRLGKNCFSWINNHPQLIEQQIKVVCI